MKGAIYRNTNDSVQMSFKYSSHENLTISAVADTSEVLGVTEIILSLIVAAHVKIGSGNATVTEMVLPAGVWALSVNPTDTISVIKLTGSSDGMASLIKVEG
jgi:hypothetical protein